MRGFLLPELTSHIVDANEMVIGVIMQWIKCSDRLPDTSSDILFVRNGCNDVHTGYRSDTDVFYSYSADGLFDIECITHWMELPEPPTGE